ncbi:hypothetical protein [Haliangium sp.]|uniref:hypothetical protein n=1 Tax=Haliangium sp. TaxID=2663208 RepID=UPI003D10C13C
MNTDRSLVTSSQVRAWTGDLLSTASRFRRQVYQLDGFILTERVDYQDDLRVREPKLRQRAPEHERRQAVFQVSVPIEALPSLLDWLRAQSLIVEQYVSSQRDGALPAPTEAAGYQQQQRTLQDRLDEIAAALAQASPEEAERIEALEAERASLLAALEQAKASMRVPELRMARLDVYFESERPQIRFAASLLVPSVRVSMLSADLLSRGDAREPRLGAAVGVSLPSPERGGFIPSPLIEVAGYPETANQGSAVLVTMGGAVYARSRGEGAGSLFNPFAGLRMGYAFTGAHSFAVAGELGVELVKRGGLAWSVSARPHGLIGKDSTVALEAGSSLSIAF